jgi:hypothetical protein
LIGGGEVRFISVSLGAIFVFTSALGHAQSLILPQIADGGGWQTAVVLTNTNSNTASASLSFYMDTSNGATQAWNLAFLEGGSTQGISLPAGATVFLHTTGAGAVTSTGWGQLNGDAGVAAYAIFTLRVPGRQDQDGTAPAASPASRILVPFDDTAGAVTAVALVNTNGSSQTISANFRTSNGTVTQSSLANIPAQGHLAVTLPQQFSALSGQSGLAEFYSSTGSFSLIGLRFNPTGAFTAAPVYAQTGPPVIGGGGSSGSGNLPAFSSLTITGTFTPENQPPFRVSIQVVPLLNGYLGNLTGGPVNPFPAPAVTGISALWNSVAISGYTLTFNSFQLGSGSLMTDSSRNSYGATFGTLTLTLSPQGAVTTGNVSGPLSLISSLATLNGTITGTYVLNPQ